MIDNVIHFEREQQKFVKMPRIIADQANKIRKNQLLLFFAQAQNDPEAIAAYTWFNQDLIFADTTLREDARILTLKASLKDTAFKERFLAFLKYADFNITDIDVLDNLPKSSSDFSYHLWPYNVIITHTDEQGNEFKLNMLAESSGTAKFIAVALELLLNNLDDTKVIVFDEFNRSFHQELSQALLHLINRKSQNNQFILTTHELSLMNGGLRSDQIYFAQKKSGWFNGFV